MERDIWVGVNNNGKFLVYDKAMQLPECPHIFLWKVEEGEMGKFIAEGIRKVVKPITDKKVKDNIANAYEKWQIQYGKEWLNKERPYYADRKKAEQKKQNVILAKKEAERIANLSLEDRHKERLQNLGIEYQGVRQALNVSEKRRVTHCYACKEPLDNSVDIECVTCGWILCKCGACGCGFQKS